MYMYVELRMHAVLYMNLFSHCGKGLNCVHVFYKVTAQLNSHTYTKSQGEVADRARRCVIYIVV